MPNRANSTKYILLALLAESFIIYASVLVKIIDLTPIMLGFYRVTLAIPIFLLFAGKAVLKVPPKDIAVMILAGLFFGLDLVFFNTALHRTSVTHVNLIGSLVCFILVPAGVLIFGEKLKLNFILGASIALLGIPLLVGGKHDSNAASFLGDFLAFLSMCGYSIFLILVYKIRQQYDTMVLMFFACIGSSALLLAAGALLEGASAPLHTRDWLLTGLVVLFGQVIGQGAFGYIMGKLDTQASSLVLICSPVLAGLLGFLLLGERLGIIEVLGIGIIIWGVYIAQKPASR